MAKKPWFKFYSSDWRADEALRMCSIGARGLWMELLCLMDVAEPRGFLLVKGKRPSVPQIASLSGLGPEECGKLLRELAEHEVFSRRQDGTIFSRKMVREARNSNEQSLRRLGGAVVENADELALGDTRLTRARVPEARDQNPETRIQNHEPDPSTRAVARSIWDDAPSASRKRSSIVQVERALISAAHRGRNILVIQQAVHAYFQDPDTARENHRFAKGVHRVILNDFWETWAEADGLHHLETATPMWKQRRMLEGWMKEGPGYWTASFGPTPDEPGCVVSDEVMQELGYLPRRAKG